LYAIDFTPLSADTAEYAGGCLFWLLAVGGGRSKTGQVYQRVIDQSIPFGEK
jgi:hypothetical protein